jgi:hypothetical protein
VDSNNDLQHEHPGVEFARPRESEIELEPNLTGGILDGMSCAGPGFTSSSRGRISNAAEVMAWRIWPANSNG